jgi:D-inositol-3-phosphate glycosyltransferase
VSRARRDGVLLVGQGAPARGGIPSFIATVLGDAALAARVPFEVVNTTRGPTRPGAASLENLRRSLADVVDVWRGARRTRIVHLCVAPAPLFPLLRTLALASAGRLGGARVLVHAHSGRMHRSMGSAAYRAALRLLDLVADRIVVVSEDGRDAVREAGGEAILLENAIDTEAYAERDTPPDATLVFVGTVCERKGLDDLRETLLRLRDDGPAPDAVTIVGDGRQEGPGVFERVRDAYAASGLLDTVRFTGAVPPDAVRDELSRGGIFCLPSHWEGLPISMLEAMAAGCAVVATDVGEIRAVLGDDGIVVAPHRPDELAAALRELLADPERRARLGAAAAARVRARYGVDRLREELLAIYAGLGYSR